MGKISFILFSNSIQENTKLLNKYLQLPDIVLYNSADDYAKGFMQSKAMVKPDGSVFW